MIRCHILLCRHCSKLKVSDSLVGKAQYFSCFDLGGKDGLQDNTAKKNQYDPPKEHHNIHVAPSIKMSHDKRPWSNDFLNC